MRMLADNSLVLTYAEPSLLDASRMKTGPSCFYVYGFLSQWQTDSKVGVNLERYHRILRLHMRIHTRRCCCSASLVRYD